MFKDNSTEKIKHQLKEKIQFYLNENLPKRQGFFLQAEPVERPVRNYSEPKKKEDAGGIRGAIAQYAPMLVTTVAPLLISGVKTKLTQKIAAKASKTTAIKTARTINEDGPKRQGSSEQQTSGGAAFQRPQIGGGAASAGDGGGVMGTVGTIATQAPTAIMLAQMARKKAAEKAAQKLIEKGTEKVVEQGTKEVVKRGSVQAVKRVGGEVVKRVGTEVVKRVGTEAIKVGLRTAATTALQGVGASSVAAVAGTAVAGAAIGTAAAYGVNRGIDALMGSKPGEGLADRQFETDTYNPSKIWQGIVSLKGGYGKENDEMMATEVGNDLASAKQEFRDDERGQNLRAGKAEEKAAGDKFDREYLAKAGNTKEGLEAIKNGTPNPDSGSANGSAEGKQEQNINFMYGADSGNVRTRGGSVNITSTQDQDYKGTDNAEQHRKFNIKVKNDAAPMVAGSEPDSPLNMMLQDQATNRQGYVKLGDVNIDSEQTQGIKYNDPSVKFDAQQASPAAAPTAAATVAPIARQKGTGPSADTLTDAAQGSREIVTTTAAPTPAPTPAPTTAPTAAPTAAPIDPRVIKMKKDRELLAAQGKTKGVIINGVVQPD